MALCKKALLPTLLCLTMTTVLFGYELTFNNFTDKTLIIMSKKRAAIQERYYQIVAPGKSVIQAWHDANCLESLYWAELNPSLPRKGGLDFVNKNQGNQIPADKQKEFDETFFSKTSGKGLYLWNNIKIVMVPNDLYNEMKKNAVKLVQGFDKAVCQTIQNLLLTIKDTAFAAMNVGLSTLENQLTQALQDKMKASSDEAKAQVNELIEYTQKTLVAHKANMETYVTNKLNALSNKKECFFNLGQIAKAAGKIHGISICTNRDFILFDTQETDELTGMPLIIAETMEGG